MAALESTGFRWEKLSLKDPLSAEGACVRRAEAIRPALILHLLFLHHHPISHKQDCPQNLKIRRVPTAVRKALTEHKETK